MDKKITYIKATALNRGKASFYLKDIHENNSEAIVVKNSEPYAVIISMEKYTEYQAMEKRLFEYEKRLDKLREDK